MPQDDRSDDVHVLHATERPRRRLGGLVGLLLLVAFLAATAWVLVEKPFAQEEAARGVPPADDNLLRDAWSFESTETTSAVEAWTVHPRAGAGFAFTTSAAVSGERGAVFEPGDEAFARMLSSEAFALAGRDGLLELSATSGSPNTQLFVRFEGRGRPPVEVVVASGGGTPSGTVTPPPGYETARAGFGAVGPASLDDVVLRWVDGERARPRPHGAFELFDVPPGLLVLRGGEFALLVEGVTLARDDAVPLPPAVVARPHEDVLALPGGVRVTLTHDVSSEGDRYVVESVAAGLPDGARLLTRARVGGVLAAAPVGLTSERGYETFTGDFRVEGAEAVLLGDATNRLQLEPGGPATVAASHREDGVLLTIGRAAPRRRLAIKTSFQSERIEASQHLDRGRQHERAGRLGEALVAYETVVRRFPHDEDALAEATAARARLEADLRERLEQIDADLEDALFLASAARCREVLAMCEQGRDAFAGSAAQARFAERAAEVAERAASLLEEDRERRRSRLLAIRDSFAAAGGYPHVVAEIDAYLDEHLAPTAEVAGDGR